MNPAASIARVAIFDLDGTLVQTPDAIVAIICRVLAGLGRQVDAVHAGGTIGQPLDHSLAMLLGVPVAHEDVTSAIESYKREFARYITTQGTRLLYPGVQAGLQLLQASGWKLGIATSKTRQTAEQTISAAGLTDFAQAVGCHDDVERGKPFPDMALLVASRLQTPPDQCVVIGDALGDIIMGTAARMRTIGVSYGVASQQELEQVGALVVADSFGEVVTALVSNVSRRFY